MLHTLQATLDSIYALIYAIESHVSKASFNAPKFRIIANTSTKVKEEGLYSLLSNVCIFLFTHSPRKLEDLSKGIILVLH